MRFLEFRNALKDFPVFSYQDILKVDALFDRRRLVEWQHKKYIRKIRNGFYTFTDEKISEGLLLYISNIIYKPSYLSLESALSFYNLIPEAVYLISAISTKKTSSFETPDASYIYRNIRKELFFGYDIVSVGDYTIKIADPQKAILDFLYFKLLNSKSELEGLRLNIPAARELISIPKIESYLSLYESKIMETRVKLFLDYMYVES